MEHTKQEKATQKIEFADQTSIAMVAEDKVTTEKEQRNCKEGWNYLMAEPQKGRQLRTALLNVSCLLIIGA